MIGCEVKKSVRLPGWLVERIEATDETSDNFSRKLKLLLIKSVGREHEPPFSERTKKARS